MKKQYERIGITLILIAGFLTSVLLAFLSGNIYKTEISDWGSDSMHYSDTALAFLERHTFHAEDSLFFGPFQRVPGYPIFLATLYSIFGRQVVSIWIGQLIIWLFSLTLLWRISARFFSDYRAFIPSFLLSLYWGAAYFVSEINSDLLALFLVLSFVLALLRYWEAASLLRAILLGVLFTALVLTKPIMLYAAPFLLAIFFMKKETYWGERLNHIVAVYSIIIFSVGAWAMYNYQVLGTPQLASGALTLMRRADDVEFSNTRFAAFTVASLFGDTIADKMFSGYATDPEPYTNKSIEREHEYYASQLPDKSNETALQKKYYSYANELIFTHPIKFLLTGIPYVFRLNTPMNHEGIEITASKQPIFYIGVRLLWFVFLVCVLFGVWRSWKDYKVWPLMFLILYTTVMYALVSHAEARYILPVLPLYFLFAAYTIRIPGLQFALDNNP